MKKQIQDKDKLIGEYQKTHLKNLDKIKELQEAVDYLEKNRIELEKDLGNLLEKLELTRQKTLEDVEKVLDKKIGESRDIILRKNYEDSIKWEFLQTEFRKLKSEIQKLKEMKEE